MRELSFSGFLTKYVRELSAHDTNSVFRLVEEAATSNARLREPVLLYALLTGKRTALQSAARKNGLEDFYGDLLNYSDERLLKDIQNSLLPAEYQKVWKSFLAKRNRYQTDSDTKELMRKKILKLQTLNGTTNYRIYTDLGLNPGNINAWLKYGKGEKVSLDTARNILRYFE